MHLVKVHLKLSPRIRRESEGELGIRSNVVVPGFMETAMSATLTEEQKNRIYKRTSMKAAISVRSVAETVAFLLSDGACSITGVEVRVDNGTI